MKTIQPYCYSINIHIFAWILVNVLQKDKINQKHNHETLREIPSFLFLKKSNNTIFYTLA